MHIDIKTADTRPIRHTYAHVAERFGDKPASRYQEATYDIQEVENFHYRPLWQPDKELYDASRTAIVMADWYSLKDPRQFYYQTYTNVRARQQEIVEGQFDFVCKKAMLDAVPGELRELALRILVPLRHYEWGANMNNDAITAWGYGATLTNAAMFATMDRLGSAQYLSKIGLLADGNLGTSLTQAREQWLGEVLWQPLRAALERLFIERDWFQLFIAQNLVFDGLLYPLVYQHFERHLATRGGSAFSLLLTFQSEWFAETTPWVDAVCQTAAVESAANRLLLSDWAARARADILQALAPLAREMFAFDAHATLDAVNTAFGERLARIGLSGDCA